MRKYWLAVLLGVTVLAAGCKGSTDTTDTAKEASAEDTETTVNQETETSETRVHQTISRQAQVPCPTPERAPIVRFWTTSIIISSSRMV